MRPLPRKFTDRGWGFQQLKRDGLIALFLKTKTPVGGRQIETFEIIKINENKERECHGSILCARESYPPSAAWGMSGWSTSSNERAEEMFYYRANASKTISHESVAALFIPKQCRDSRHTTKAL